MLYTPSTNPIALGLITQASHTNPPVPLNVNIVGDDSCFFVEVEAYKTTANGANTGLAYIVNSDGSQVIKTLAKGERWGFEATGNAGNPFRLSNLFLAVDSDGDGIVGRAVRR